MEPDDTHPIFISIAAGNLESVRAIVDKHGLGVVKFRVTNRTAVEYLIYLLQTTDNPNLVANFVAIAQYLLDEAINTDDDELAAWLVNQEPRCVILDEDTCPAFTGACVMSLQNTSRAILNLNILTDGMLDHAIRNMIESNSYHLIGDLFQIQPALHARDRDYIADSVNLNKPFCLLELLKAGCDPTANITFGFQVLENDVHQFHIPTHGNALTNEGYSINALIETCLKPDGDQQQDLDRTACTLVLLENYAGQDLWLYNACDYIIVESCLTGNFDSISLLTSVGISPEALFLRYLGDVADKNIDVETKAFLCQGIVSACTGINAYLDRLLEWDMRQFIEEGRIGLCRTDPALAPPQDNDGKLVSLLQFFVEYPNEFTEEVVEAAASALQKIAAIAEALREFESLAQRSRDIVLNLNPGDPNSDVRQHINDVILFETRNRHQHPGQGRRHYQLMALAKLLSEYPEFAHYYQPV